MLRNIIILFKSNQTDEQSTNHEHTAFRVDIVC